MVFRIDAKIGKQVVTDQNILGSDREINILIMIKICRLCQSEREVKLSHIVPRFVLEWLFNTSPGYLRNASNPNLRIQDGIKSELLCEDCEQRLSKWEKAFAENIFKPLHESHGKTAIFPYNDWAMKFAVSVSWRVLSHIKQLGLSHFSEKQKKSADRALETWAEFLLNNRDDLGPYEQHMLFFDVIERHNFQDLSPYMNRYLLRTVDMDVICSENSALVYSKMGRIALFGVISGSNTKNWKGTKMLAKEGVLGNDCQISINIYEYINDRSNRVAQSLAGISPKQRGKIDSMLRKELQDGPDKLAKSEPFTAMTHDVKLSGKAAFRATRPQYSSDK